MSISEVGLRKILEDLRDEFGRDEERALRQGSMEKAIDALRGKDVLGRIEREIDLRLRMHDNVVRMAKRAGK
jgi:hypothetical protein